MTSEAQSDWLVELSCISIFYSY